jgi:hypothetical protein
LSEARKRKVRTLARWEAKPSRSKGERIKIKMGVPQFGVEENKKYSEGGAGG